MRRSIIGPLLPCVFLASLAVSGLSSGDGKTPDTKIKRAWLACARIPEGFKNPVMAVSGAASTEISLSKRSPSGPIPIAPDGLLRLTRTPGGTGTGADKTATLAESRIPDDVDEALIVLLPGPSGADQPLFTCEIIDLSRFKGGDWLCINLTHLNIRVEIDGTTTEIRPRRHEIHRSSAASVPISYSYQDPIGQEWKLLGASSVFLQPSRREICIFTIDPRLDRVTYHGITFPVTP